MVDFENVDGVTPLKELPADNVVAREENESPADNEFLEWVSEATHDKVSSAVGRNPNTICQECDWQTGSKKTLCRVGDNLINRLNRCDFFAIKSIISNEKNHNFFVIFDFFVKALCELDY